MIRDSKESVFRRWSRRKQEATTAAVEDHETKPAQASLDTSTPTETAPVLTDADMPPIESLDENSDFSGFMSKGVSDELRNLALRKLFGAPAFNIRDGLDEYDEDYTFFEKLGDVVTCDMKHHIEMKEQREREARALAAEQDGEEEALATAAVEDDEDLEAMESIDDEDNADNKSEIVSNSGLQSDNDQGRDK